MSQFQVTFHPSPVNGWLYRILATPFMRIDSTEQQCSWSSSTIAEVQPGEHLVETYVRYKHGQRDLALGRGTFHAPETGFVSIQAANTWISQSVFMPSKAGK